jgi:hypothetical protein
MKKKVEKFLEVLKDYGELFFSSGNLKNDYNTITSVLKAQGYWAGTMYRLYFDDNFDLVKVEERF